MLQPLPNVPFGQASRERERRGEGRREGGRERGGGREEGGREREGERLGTCYTKSSLTFDICRDSDLSSSAVACSGDM